MDDDFFNTLEQIVIEKKRERNLMIKEIQELQQKLSQLKIDNYELLREVESLEHVIELFK